MNIDWSKAPEGATHINQFAGRWIKHSGKGQYQFWNGAEWEMGFGCMDNRYTKRPEPDAWTGEGQPPVGTVCEVKSTARGKERDWFKAQVKYISPFTVVLDDFPIGELEGEFVVHPDTVQFRPIKTKEQIAAEEREKAVIEMLYLDPLGGSRRGLAEALYDHGYRKQENNDAKD